jgi:hypothetical protein
MVNVKTDKAKLATQYFVEATKIQGIADKKTKAPIATRMFNISSTVQDLQMVEKYDSQQQIVEFGTIDQNNKFVKDAIDIANRHVFWVNEDDKNTSNNLHGIVVVGNDTDVAELTKLPQTTSDDDVRKKAPAAARIEDTYNIFVSSGVWKNADGRAVKIHWGKKK